MKNSLKTVYAFFILLAVGLVSFVNAQNIQENP
jgi:hypothetical protein